MDARSQYRQNIRRQRSQLSHQKRKQCAQELANRLLHSQIFRNSRRIAAYLPVQGELDPSLIIKTAWEQRKKIYLPVLTPFNDNKLWFVRYEPGTRMLNNRFGIPEPVVKHRQRLSARSLDLVLMPLVGFDHQGHRLGMGGGFYDRSFAFLLNRKHLKKPRLIGLAYDFQEIPRLTPENWDVPLDAIATPSRHFPQFRRDTLIK
ncbi:MAG: 5-formyltetrahydrofolate cyclo-ligase [Gammaproteobacteria bacterium]